GGRRPRAVPDNPGQDGRGAGSRLHRRHQPFRRELTKHGLILQSRRQARTQEVPLTRGKTEITPAEAAELLGMSRPQVRKLIDDGKLVLRTVGSHHRVKLASVDAFLEAER